MRPGFRAVYVPWEPGQQEETCFYEPCLPVSFLLPALFDGDRHRRFPKFQENCAALAYQVDPLTAGSISGMIRYIGKRPLPKKIDMSGDPACVEAHHGNALDESLVVSSRGGLANAFVYEKSGLEGKTFAAPSTPVAIDQKWVLVLAARPWYSDQPGPADLRNPIRSRTVFTHGADQPGVEPWSGSGRAAACPKVRRPE